MKILLDLQNSMRAVTLNSEFSLCGLIHVPSPGIAVGLPHTCIYMDIHAKGRGMHLILFARLALTGSTALSPSDSQPCYVFPSS